MLELALLSMALAASIGPANLYAIREGLKNGAHITFFVIFGAILVDLFYANIASLGLNFIGHSLSFKISLLIIGILFFSYIGIKGMQNAIKEKLPDPVKTKLKVHPILKGMAFSLPNPLIIIFWTSTISSLNIKYQPIMMQVAILSGGLGWATIESLIIHFSRKFIKEKLVRTIEFISSLIIFGFGIKFILELVNIIQHA